MFVGEKTLTHPYFQPSIYDLIRVQSKFKLMSKSSYYCVNYYLNVTLQHRDKIDISPFFNGPPASFTVFLKPAFWGPIDFDIMVNRPSTPKNRHFRKLFFYLKPLTNMLLTSAQPLSKDDFEGSSGQKCEHKKI